MRNIDDVALLPSRAPGQTATLLADPVAEPLFCPIVSADDHVLEPPDLFRTRVPAALADAAPSVVTDDEGVPYWQVDDVRIPVVVLNGAVGRPIREWDATPQRFDEFRAGVLDARRRLVDMDLCGIWASLCFPSIVWGFTGSVFSQMRDREAGLASMRAYNDWMLDEWCATAPDRYISCQVPWLADPEVAAAEVRRNAARGFVSVSFSENPEGKGFPSMYSTYWDPFLAACEETGTVVNLHVGSSGRINQPSSESPIDVLTALFPVNGITTIVDWIYAKVPNRFPGLRIVLSEAGASWVPMVVERLRRAWRQVDSSGAWTRADGDPVEALRRNFWFTSIEDPLAFRVLDLIGDDRVLVETDYPHQDSTWPHSQDYVRRQLAGLPASSIRRICFGNACALFGHPPPPDDLVARSEVGAPDQELVPATRSPGGR